MSIRYLKVFLIFILSSFVSKITAQGIVSIYNHTVSVSPSYTLSHGSSFTVAGSVVNTSSMSINGNVHVHFAIDTSSVGGQNKFLTRVSNTYPQSNFLPTSTFTFSLADNADIVNAYKVAGNGITVIIWATVGPNPNDSTTTKDSVYSHIYVLPPLQSLENENAFEENQLIVQNPVNSILEFRIQNSESELDYMELINSNGVILISQHINADQSSLSTHHLLKGIYYLRVTNKRTHTIITKKIIIN